MENELASQDGDAALMDNELVSPDGDAPLMDNELASPNGDAALMDNELASQDGDVSLMENELASQDGYAALMYNELASQDGDVALMYNELASPDGDAPLMDNELASQETSYELMFEGRPLFSGTLYNTTGNLVHSKKMAETESCFLIKNIYIANGNRTVVRSGRLSELNSRPNLGSEIIGLLSEAVSCPNWALVRIDQII